MPVLSYIAYPNKGKLTDLVLELNSFPQCEIVPANNKELAILVTDTQSEKEEEELQEQLKQVKNLQCLTMVFGHSDPSNL